MADTHDRTIPATPRRREQARRQGLGAPADLPAWAASAGVAILLLPAWARQSMPAARDALCEAITAAVAVDRGAGFSWTLAAAMLLPTVGLLTASAVAGLAVRFACDGLSWRPGRAAVDPRRINPLAGLGRIFSRGTLATLLTASAGLAVIVVAGFVLARPLAALQQRAVAAGDLGGVAVVAWRAMAGLVVTAAALAAGQWLLARRRFERSIRMTPTELAEEQKELQADPRVKLLQRQRQPAGRGRPQPTSGTS